MIFCWIVYQTQDHEGIPLERVGAYLIIQRQQRLPTVRLIRWTVLVPIDPLSGPVLLPSSTLWIVSRAYSDRNVRTYESMIISFEKGMCCQWATVTAASQPTSIIIEKVTDVWVAEIKVVGRGMNLLLCMSDDKMSDVILFPRNLLIFTQWQPLQQLGRHDER